jgi:hypothetical protein
MIIQGSPEILRGPRGLNGFGDFGATNPDPVSEGFYTSPEYTKWATSSLVVDVNNIYNSPYFGPVPGGNFGPTQDAAYEKFKARGGVAPELTATAALDLLYRSSTTGAPTQEFDLYGGYAVVKDTAVTAGYTGTPQNIQNYEIANNIFESASTALNKQFIGPEGEARMALIESNLTSQDAAAVAGATAALQAARATADAEFAAAEAARLKVISDAYEAAKEAARVEDATRTAAAAARRALTIAELKKIYLLVLEREGADEGLNYFADKFGDVIDPDELQLFKDMAQPEIDARNKYLADMAAQAKALSDLATANALAVAAVAASARGVTIRATMDKATGGTAGGGTAGGGVNPALILAAAAAAFFIGG